MITQRKTAVGAFAYVYIHGIGVPFPYQYGEGAACAIRYMQVWRRYLLLLILGVSGFPRTSIGKGDASDRFPTPFLF